MGVVSRLIMGRWFSRWVLRGGPWAVGAKLAGVAAYGVWQWRREQKKLDAQVRDREIAADYEVLDPDETAEEAVEKGRGSLPQGGLTMNGGSRGTTDDGVV